MRMFKKCAMVVASVLFVASLSACNTMNGIGKDISAGGNSLARAAKKDESKDSKKAASTAQKASKNNRT